MESISYDQKCNSNKDCESNVCELVYENGKPKGRYCLINTGNKYTKKCSSNKDCMSGECKTIYDQNNEFLTRKCVKAPKIDTDTSFNTLFGKDRSNEYGLLNSDTIAIQAGERGPITEIMIKIFSIIGNMFNIIIFNTDVCGENRRTIEKKCQKGKTDCCGENIQLTPFGRCKKNEDACSAMTERANHGLLYGIWQTVFDAVFGSLMKNAKNGFLWGGIQSKHYNSSTGKCDKTNSANGFDLWYIRMLLTILFPPFGIFMSKGLKGMGQILICSALTACFYFPGLIYAFSVMNSSNNELQEINELKDLQNLK
jgi:uncharacterized membrane protein YqaE (UPF0057 family)